jgi:hypothetical protein
MAARKEIPSRLANSRIPKCQSYLYGKATKRPWRTKGQSRTLKKVTLPGQCVSMDQLESPVAGFIGQHKGFFFRKRYKVATIFVDHFSRLSYVYFQESTKGMQSLAAKRSFEAYSFSYGVKVQQYLADNGRFAEHLLLNHCDKSGQKVSLCGVSAYFQNGSAERRIKDLTERSRTSLLHTIHRWPSAVTINLWQYALCYINEVYNATPALKTGRSPLEAFSQTAIRPKVLDFHPLLCPVYVLHNGLQSGGSRPNKWVRGSRVAIPSLSKGAMMSRNCPCSKQVTGWVKLFAIHPPGRPPGPPFHAGRAALPSVTTTGTGRASIPPELFMEQVYAVLDDSDTVEDYELQRDAEDPIAFPANGSDPDSLHYNAAMKAHDSEDFKVAMIKEANDHTTRLHWELWEKLNVPAGHKILSAIWAFKQKRRIDTRAVYKHKARINIHGG